ncbi:membrane protein insertion efficiency factor YidD [Dietzia timorensis]|nr:membrane protein insertion efficiency factor YidD [Dietzia timorensis]
MSRDDTGRGSLLSRGLTLIVVFYREAVSPLFPPSCRFEPTCSEYALEALKVHGALRGSGLIMWRILRCAPWSKGGWDPVPPPRSP